MCAERRQLLASSALLPFQRALHVVTSIRNKLLIKQRAPGLSGFVDGGCRSPPR